MKKNIFLLLFALFLPFLDSTIPAEFQVLLPTRTILVFAIMATGLHLITGLAGVLHLGSAAFMALGAYTYAILTYPSYPFQAMPMIAIALTAAVVFVVGALLGLPALRLRGDYLAIVTLGLGEIMQDLLKNVDTITKGTQGLNPLPRISLPFTANLGGPVVSYYTALLFFLAIIALTRRLEISTYGRALRALAQDELAAKSMGIQNSYYKVTAFALSSMFAGIAGALWVSFLASSGEPGNYDFQISATVLCCVIAGGLGIRQGILLGTVLMVGLNTIVLTKLTTLFASLGISPQGAFAFNNWKYLLFGLTLLLVMRFAPHGIAGHLHKKDKHHA